MSGQTSHAKRAKTISRVVALSAMADDKSSVHEAAIAKKRVEKLIAAYNITERELILAGWKKPVPPSAQASNQAKPSRQSSDKKTQSKTPRASKQRAKTGRIRPVVQRQRGRAPTMGMGTSGAAGAASPY